ncbi:MAG: PASTA domain-containing protein [Myxococcota bacterium]
MSKTSGTIAVSVTTSLITSSIMFLVLQFFVVPNLGKEEEKKPVEVPSVVGLKPENAKMVLKQRDFLMTVKSHIPHKEHPKGIIAKQEPLPGSMLKNGETVKVLISSGVPQVKVPSLVGKMFDDVKGSLKSKKFEITTEQRLDENGKEGQILSQKPAPNKRVDSGTTIQLVLAKTPDTIKMPDFTKKILNKKKWEKKLKELGLKLGKVRYVDRADVSDGYIYSHKPKAEEEVEKGTEVEFVVQHFFE